ncbi:Ig-like domain-containing protein [Crateriforma spongiae]|uniref:Ig-like domain-containing protein n=1 Tax=Crateriforma spongiae TaxID=2724528 RepID=UPI001446290F|nr:Ig-like domain-containing protein [Crateriforma spongiae]
MSRNALRQLIASLTGGFPHKDAVMKQPRGDGDLASRGPLRLEMLERRQLMAGDVEMMFTDGNADGLPDAGATATAQSDVLAVTGQAEGESEPDLVQFAKNLEAAGVQFFGAAWCPACTQQKELFEDGGDELPFVEVTNPDRTLNSIGIAEGISQFPTWRFPDDTEATGVLDLTTISSRSGVPIPQSETPTFETIGSQTVRIGSPLHVVVDGYDPDGSVLTTTVTVEDPSLIEATVISGNRSLRLDVAGFGDMVFELFEQRAPVPAGRVADLAESGFYDGIIFHRVVNGFVIQAGDPTGTGTSGSTLGSFDDQFHPDLQHNRDGILSFAKTSDDTNNSQFFITETDTRHLDFNHSIFGQLVEGEDVREAISNMETDPPASQGGGAPTTDIVIEDASVFTDTENSVVMFKAVGGTGTTNVTITVTDEDGNTHSEVIPVTVVADTGSSSDSQPFLGDINDPVTSAVDTPAQLQLSAVDVEGDAVRYSGSIVSGQGNATLNVDSTTGLVTVTPASGFTGTVDVNLTVAAASGATGSDNQVVTFEFVESQLSAPTGLDLLATSDSGSSDSDNVTNEGTLSFTVTGVESGDTVEIINTDGDAVIGSAVAAGSTVTITTSNIAALGDGSYTLAARRSNGGSSSGNSATLTVTYDNTGPATVGDTATTQANVGTQYITNLISSEEGSGLVYSLISSPTGATINPATGQITWDPQAADVGTVDFDIRLTDLAGNATDDSFSVTVSEPAVAGVRLEITDLDGNVITSVASGEEFLLRMYGQDLRPGIDRRGVFAAFADILFDANLIQPVSGATIQYGSGFNTVQDGTFASGLIDELGAAQSNTVPSDESESLVATIRMEAIASGTVNITSEPADDSGSETLLYLSDERIPAASVAYGNISLAIDQNFTVVDDTFTVDEDSTSNTLDVLDNDTAVAGTTLTIVSVTQPTTGGAVSISNGELIFTPTADFVGEVVFSYRVANSDGVQDDATVTVTVEDVNDPPLGAPDTFTVDQGTVLNDLDVLDNDSIAPDTGEELTVTGVGTTSNGGTVTVASDGKSVLYTPPADFTGVDTFTYTLSDGEATVPVTVSVTVNPGDEPPVAVNDAFTVTEDAAEASFDILANDTRDSENQAFELLEVATPSNGGTASVGTDGELRYQPAANFVGTETVQYTIRDTGGGLAVGTVTFTVTGVNDPPPAADATADVLRSAGESVVLTVADLPTNVDSGETLQFTATGTTSQGGTVRISTAGDQILYTPPAGDFTGDDTFTFTVSDPSGATSTAALTVTVSDYELRDFSFALSSAIPGVLHGVRLVGTDDLGAAVDVAATQDANGQFVFADQLPGDYKIMIPAVPFLQKGGQPIELELNSAPEDGDAALEADLGRLRPQYLSIRDWFGGAARRSIVAAVSPGEEPVFMQTSQDTGDVSDPDVQLSNDGTQVTVTGKDDQDADVQATLNVQSGNRVEVRGQVGDLRLLKISVEPTDVSFTEVASAGTASTAEGEAAAATGQSVLSNDQAAEGESPVVAAVTQVDAVVPAASPVSVDQTPQQDASGVGSDADTNVVGDSMDAQQVDASMPQVASRLSLLSSAADQLAEPDDDLSADAVDAALSS